MDKTTDEKDRRAAQLEALIRNCRALHGKLGEALTLSLGVPGIYDHSLRVMRDNLNEQIAGFYRELKGITP